MALRPVVLVTGCSSGGIGHSLAEAFAARGCCVYASSRSTATMAGLEAKGCTLLCLDVCSVESIDEAVAKVVAEVGQIDILVNNAGVGGVMPALDTPDEAARRIFETNFFGLFQLTKAVGKHMVERRAGKILNVGSVAGLSLNPFTGLYSASKAAVHSLTHSLRQELRPFGVQVMYVAPGLIATPISAKAGDWSLAQWQASRYGPVVPHIQSDLLSPADSNPQATQPAEFARRLVNTALRPSLPFEFVYGHASGIVTFMAGWLPRWLTDKVFYARFKFDKLAAAASYQR